MDIICKQEFQAGTCLSSLDVEGILCWIFKDHFFEVFFEGLLWIRDIVKELGWTSSLEETFPADQIKSLC